MMWKILLLLLFVALATALDDQSEDEEQVAWNPHPLWRKWKNSKMWRIFGRREMLEVELSEEEEQLADFLNNASEEPLFLKSTKRKPKIGKAIEQNKDPLLEISKWDKKTLESLKRELQELEYDFPEFKRDAFDFVAPKLHDWGPDWELSGDEKKFLKSFEYNKKPMAQQLDEEEVSHRDPGFFWKFMQKFGNMGLFTVLDHTKKSKKIKKWIKRFERKKGMKKLWDMDQEKLRSKIDKAIKNFRSKKASKGNKKVSHRAVGFFWKFLQKFGNKGLFTALGHEKKSKKMKEWIKKFEKKKGMKKLWDMDTEELRSKIDNLIKHFRGKNASKSNKIRPVKG